MAGHFDSSNLPDKNFTLSAHLNGNVISFLIVPFYQAHKRAFRVVSEHIPELVLRLNDLDTWEAAGDGCLLAETLVAELGEKLDNYLLEHRLK